MECFCYLNVPSDSPSRGGDVTGYVWHKPTELARFFLFCSCVCFCPYGPFNCISFHKFSRQLSVFSLCSSGLISLLLVLSTIYLFMKVSLSPDMTPSGWLGSKHQLTNVQSKTHQTVGVMVPFVRGFLTAFTTWFGVDTDQIRALSHRPVLNRDWFIFLYATTFASTPLCLRCWKSGRMDACAREIILGAYRIWWEIVAKHAWQHGTG